MRERPSQLWMLVSIYIDYFLNPEKENLHENIIVEVR